MFKRLLSSNVSELISIDLSVLLLRISAGALIFTHGLPKLQKVFNGDFAFADPIGLGPELTLILSALAEGVCSILLMFGFATRYAALVLIINMSAAYFFFHAADPFNAKELALMYLMLFVVLFFTGAGKYSLDHKLFTQK